MIGDGHMPSFEGTSELTIPFSFFGVTLTGEKTMYQSLYKKWGHREPSGVFALNEGDDATPKFSLAYISLSSLNKWGGFPPSLPLSSPLL